MKKDAARVILVLGIVLSFTLITKSTDSQVQQPSRPVREEMTPDEFFISFKDSMTDEKVESVRALGMAVRHQFSKINAISTKISDPSLVSKMENDPRVDYIEPVPMRYPLSLETEQLVPSLNNGLYGLLTTNSVEAQSRGITGAGINVGVADTGIDYTHPDIAPNYKGGIDTIAGDNDPFWNNDPNETHGTHVAGTILAANNNIGVLGVAYNANLYYARVLGPNGGSAADIMEGVQWLVETAHCKVVNLSLGGSTGSKTEKKFYKLMRSEGALVVCAAGNDGANKLSYPARYPSNIAVGAVDSNNQLASFSNTGKNLGVVAPGLDVLSSVPKDQGAEASVSTTSSFTAFPLEFAGETSGTSQQLVFCGLGMASDFPESARGNIALIQRGTNSFVEKVTNAMNAGAVAVIIYNNVAGDFLGTLGSATTADGRVWIPAVSVSDSTGVALKSQAGSSAASGVVSTVVNQKSSWDTYSGTSMAAPHVTGVIALIWSANPNLSNSTVEDFLFSTCTDLGPSGYDSDYGFGLVNASASVAKAEASK